MKQCSQRQGNNRQLARAACGAGSKADPVQSALFQSLRAWRLEQARAQKVPAYVVLSDRVLGAIATQLPVTLEALSHLKGIGPRKLEQYGQAVIELVREHAQ